MFETFVSGGLGMELGDVHDEGKVLLAGEHGLQPIACELELVRSADHRMPMRLRVVAPHGVPAITFTVRRLAFSIQSESPRAAAAEAEMSIAELPHLVKDEPAEEERGESLLSPDCVRVS